MISVKRREHDHTRTNQNPLRDAIVTTLRQRLVPTHSRGRCQWPPLLCLHQGVHPSRRVELGGCRHWSLAALHGTASVHGVRPRVVVSGDLFLHLGGIDDRRPAVPRIRFGSGCLLSTLHHHVASGVVSISLRSRDALGGEANSRRNGSALVLRMQPGRFGKQLCASTHAQQTPRRHG